LEKVEEQHSDWGYAWHHPHDVLDEGAAERIHRGALEVLARCGVLFGGEAALRLLEQAGCAVDCASGRVCFPERLVQECVQQCPRRFTLRARTRNLDLDVGPGRLYVQSHPGLFLVDLETGQRRLARLADIGPMVRLLDALDEIHLPIMPVSTVVDKPSAVAIEWLTAEVLRNTQKSTAGGVFDGCAPWVVEMAAVTGQHIYGQLNPVTPLHYSAEQLEGTGVYLRAGHPVCILPGPTLGANSPATLAGTLALQTAEHLAGVVWAQLVQPGAPVTMGSYPHLLDMRQGELCIGAVEVGLLGAATAQLGRRYGIPTHPQLPLTDAKAHDEQAGIEKALGALLLAQSGASLITNGGGLETEKAWSPVQLVIDCEVNAMVGRTLRGIDVTDETLAVDLIREKSLSGNFLATRHTQHAWKREQWLPRLADRRTYEAWQAGGSSTMVERAREWARETVRSHRVPSLSEDQNQELDRILQAAERAKLNA
jgi:trimethylamine--corrinoid protein Co-methyltransferase